MATFPPPVRRPLLLDELGPEPESPSSWDILWDAWMGTSRAAAGAGSEPRSFPGPPPPPPPPAAPQPPPFPGGRSYRVGPGANAMLSSPKPSPSAPFVPETTLAEDITRESSPTPEQLADLRAIEYERRPPIRAVRLPGPGNRLTFTNIPGAYPEGEDIGMDRVGGILRGAEAATEAAGVASMEVPTESNALTETALTPSWARGTNFEGPKFSPTRMVSMDPESSTLRGLIRSAARAAVNRDGGGGGGAAQPRGAFSTGIVGTPQRRAQYMMDDLLQAAALSSARNAATVAAMSPIEQSRLGNRDVVAGGYRMGQIKPLLDEALDDAMAKLAVANKIPDPTQRQMAIDGIQNELKMKRENISALAAAASGTRGFPFE